MIRWIRLAPVALVAGAGCLASKGDIRLLQDEFRATRAQLGMVDTSIVRTNEQRRQQIATLASTVDRLSAAVERTSDSLRVLAARFDRFQGNVNGELEVLQQQMVRTQALLGQNVKNLQETQRQLEELREGRGVTGAPPAGGSSSSPQGPGPATLFTSGRDALATGAYATARRAFDDLLAAYPDGEYASRAMLYVGDAYFSEKNLSAADSVYQRVEERYPKTDEAPTAMFKRATTILWPSRKAEARALLDKIVKDYPNATVRSLARDFLRDNR
jgi:tol-pal system protein YbgF